MPLSKHTEAAAHLLLRRCHQVLGALAICNDRLDEDNSTRAAADSGGLTQNNQTVDRQVSTG
jgi:hypothetical protein